MKVVIQRVANASVSIDDVCIGEIKQGLMILVGIHELDTKDDISYLVRKICNLRIFEDETGKMNQSIQDVSGSILSISQFTLYADTKKGNRPSFIKAAKPAISIPLYDSFNESLRKEGISVTTGEFGADMNVSLVNNGPVTIIIDTQENKKK